MISIGTDVARIRRSIAPRPTSSLGSGSTARTLAAPDRASAYDAMPTPAPISATTAPARLGPMSRMTSPNSAEPKNRSVLSTTSRPRYTSATSCAEDGSARSQRMASSSGMRLGSAPSGMTGSGIRSAKGLCAVALETGEDARQVDGGRDQHEQRVCDDAAPDDATDPNTLRQRDAQKNVRGGHDHRGD